jgi:hypothetical protein
VTVAGEGQQLGLQVRGDDRQVVAVGGDGDLQRAAAHVLRGRRRPRRGGGWVADLHRPKSCWELVEVHRVAQLGRADLLQGQHVGLVGVDYWAREASLASIAAWVGRPALLPTGNRFSTFQVISRNATTSHLHPPAPGRLPSAHAPGSLPVSSRVTVRKKPGSS